MSRRANERYVNVTLEIIMTKDSNRNHSDGERSFEESVFVKLDPPPHAKMIDTYREFSVNYGLIIVVSDPNFLLQPFSRK